MNKHIREFDVQLAKNPVFVAYKIQKIKTVTNDPSNIPIRSRGQLNFLILLKCANVVRAAAATVALVSQ